MVNRTLRKEKSMNPEGVIGSHLPEYVIMHTLWMEKRGQKPHMGWNGITDPCTAMIAALNEVNSNSPYLISLVHCQLHQVIEIARVLKSYTGLRRATIYLEVPVDVVFCLIDSAEVPEVDRANWVLYYKSGTQPSEGKLEKVEIPWIAIKEGEPDHGPMIKIFAQIPTQGLDAQAPKLEL